jgi:carbonic anhydrase/acetyltransferase-like protein (isoleucine patch superfamily)
MHARALCARSARAAQRESAPALTHTLRFPPFSTSLSRLAGPGALLQSCTIEDNASIGAGAIVLEGALVERGASVGAGAVVHPGRRIPAGQLWEGNPAVFVRDLTKNELAEAEGHAMQISNLAAEHANEFLVRRAPPS